MEDVQYDGSGSPLRYPDPVQGGSEKVTRQTGLPSWQQVTADPVPAQPVVQGDANMVTTRQKGFGTQHYDASGTLIADTRADDGAVLYVDVATMAAGDANPPGLLRTAMPLPPPSGFGEMRGETTRAALKAAAEAAGFVVSDAPGVPPAAEQSPAIEFKRGGEFVIASDQPGAGDPRDMSTGPQVLSSLPTIKKRAIVPVTTTVARVKKGKKK